MAKLKSERHHWWPECVSDFWKDSSGCVTRLTADGNAVPAPPKNWGVIQNGHLVKLALDPSEYCSWDENFEEEFRNADSNFAHLISWLAGISSEDRRDAKSLRDRFVPHEINEPTFKNLIECIVSLAVRSPRTREQAGCRAMVLAIDAAQRLTGHSKAASELESLNEEMLTLEPFNLKLKRSGK